MYGLPLCLYGQLALGKHVRVVHSTTVSKDHVTTKSQVRCGINWRISQIFFLEKRLSKNPLLVRIIDFGKKDRLMITWSKYANDDHPTWPKNRGEGLYTFLGKSNGHVT